MVESIKSKSIRACRNALKLFKRDIDRRLVNGNTGLKTGALAKQYILREMDREDLEKLVGRIENPESFADGLKRIREEIDAR